MQVLSNVFIKPFLCKLYAYIMSPQPMILFTKKQTYISNYFFQILWKYSWNRNNKSWLPKELAEIFRSNGIRYGCRNAAWFRNRNFHVKQLIMDNDSTTFAKAKASFDPNIKKISDFNHTKKNLISKLYDMKKQKKYPLLGPKTIQHLSKCFAYAVKSNSDTTTLQKNLECIPSHVFGNHNSCQSQWYRYLKDPENYRPVNLPYGRYLSGMDLFNDFYWFSKEC